MVLPLQKQKPISMNEGTLKEKKCSQCILKLTSKLTPLTKMFSSYIDVQLEL